MVPAKSLKLIVAPGDGTLLARNAHAQSVLYSMLYRSRHTRSFANIVAMSKRAFAQKEYSPERRRMNGVEMRYVRKQGPGSLA